MPRTKATKNVQVEFNGHPSAPPNTATQPVNTVPLAGETRPSGKPDHMEALARSVYLGSYAISYGIAFPATYVCEFDLAEQSSFPRVGGRHGMHVPRRILAVAGNADDDGVFQKGLPAKHSSYLVTIHSGQADIEEHEFRPKVMRFCDGRRATVSKCGNYVEPRREGCNGALGLGDQVEPNAGIRPKCTEAWVGCVPFALLWRPGAAGFAALPRVFALVVLHVLLRNWLDDPEMFFDMGKGLRGQCRNVPIAPAFGFGFKERDRVHVRASCTSHNNGRTLHRRVRRDSGAQN